MITIHHLGVSQSERIVWLFEELGIPYNLVKHTRDPLLSPKSLKDVPGNETGKAPFIEDSDTNITLSESSAIFEYVIYKYAGGRLAAKPSDKHFADYLYWFHYAIGTLQPTMVNSMFLGAADAGNKLIVQLVKDQANACLNLIDDRLKNNKWLAGGEFTAAEIMTVYSLTTQRYYAPRDLGPYKNILRWLEDCANRDAYKRAMRKGDPEMKLLLGAKAPEKSLIETDGVTSDHWKQQSAISMTGNNANSQL